MKLAKASEPLRRSKEAVKEASLAAAYELLTEFGLSGASVDEISRRSGVAKTTIYRYWPSSSALLLEACMQFAPRLQPPNTGTLKGDVTVVAAEMAARLQTGGWSSVVPSIIDAGERDQQIAELQSRQHAGMTAAFGLIAAQAQARGELDPNFDVSELTAAIAGPLFYRRWFSRQKLDDAFVRGVVERALSWSKVPTVSAGQG
jgi:AcrR family transcriptional regulator